MESVAFQGETGAYSEQAVEEMFPGAAACPRPTFEDVFESIVNRTVQFGVVPIENTLFGSVHVNYDLLREHDVQIVSEHHLRIRHNLLVAPGVALADIKEVHSHPQALGQCKHFLRAHLPDAKVVAAYDTAGAAKMLALSENMAVAAIASKRAAEEYGLSVLASSIESNRQNYTRFLALRNTTDSGQASDADFEGPGKWKTSIVYEMRDPQPGTLFLYLSVFAERKVDLLKIESRPLVGSPGSYLFYIDLDGKLNEESISDALKHLSDVTDYVKVLGSYPAGTYVDNETAAG